MRRMIHEPVALGHRTRVSTLSAKDITCSISLTCDFVNLCITFSFLGGDLLIEESIS